MWQHSFSLKTVITRWASTESLPGRVSQRRRSINIFRRRRNSSSPCLSGGRLRPSLLCAISSRSGGTPLARLQAVFDWHAVWFSSGNCTDSLFIAAITEFHHLDTDISSCSTAQKQSLTEFIAGIIEVLLDRTAAARTARQCVMLLDGALTAALADGKSAAVEEAWLAMQSIINWRMTPRGAVRH